MMSLKRFAVELGCRLDGPHDDDQTAAAAEVCSEAVRFLNYATGAHSPAGLGYPATVYMVAADLSLAASRMQQLFAQLTAWLAAEESAGHLGTDDNGPVADVVTAACANLADASDADVTQQAGCDTRRQLAEQSCSCRSH